METTVLRHPLERSAKMCRNAEKMLALECRASRDSRSAADALDALRARLADLDRETERQLQLCLRRVQFAGSDLARKTLVDRLLIDHLLRRGWLSTARSLAAQVQLTDYVDVALFDLAQRVIRALEQHDVGLALSWCNANRSKLAALDSDLEVHLRVFEFTVLIGKGDLQGAVVHAREHLAPYFGKHGQLVRKYMTLLAFVQAPVNAYAHLLDDARWAELVQLFLRDFYRMNGLSETSFLDTHLRAGLAALKTEFCGSATQSISDCPVCTQDVVELAAKIQPSARTISCLVCRLTGQVMDDANPPMALPNGQVYSRSALEAMAARNGNLVKCPETGDIFNLDECRNVFVM
ncbi:CTLH domain-containing protein [Plasmodiophora brassicae]